MAIEIDGESGWATLQSSGLGTVVDPMVVRCGELFLKGAAGAKKPNEVWSVLTANIQAIGMFFDTLLLNDAIPVFNYDSSFDPQVTFDRRVLARLNETGLVLYDVQVGDGPYLQVKQAALAKLKQLYDGTRRL